MFIVQIYSDKFSNEYKLSLAYKFRSMDPVLDKRIEELFYLNKTIGKIIFENVMF